MLLLRVIIFLALIAIGTCIVLWLVQGDRRYLALSRRITQYSLVFALMLFALLALERVLIR